MARYQKNDMARFFRNRLSDKEKNLDSCKGIFYTQKRNTVTKRTVQKNFLEHLL